MMKPPNDDMKMSLLDIRKISSYQADPSDRCGRVRK
jgi:hypothetical protein